jgi:hypothetical protein
MTITPSPRRSASAFARIVLLLAAIAVLALLHTIATDRTEAVIVNHGFETGDLTGWEVPIETESITVITNDPFNPSGPPVLPFEGEHMARIGNSQPSDEEPQPVGVNELSQVFQVTQSMTILAYNIWTYDFTGFDTFSIELITTDPPEVLAEPAGTPGVVLFSYEQQAWGSSGDTSLKSSGWRIAKMDTAGWEGSFARLTISAGGTIDTDFAFWAYVDSADDVAVDPCTCGFITNAETDEAIVGATVTLQRLDPEGWTDVNPFEPQEDSPVIDPQVNPRLTDGEGHYGWDVIAGTYRLIVEAEGYVSQTSPEVTVPPPVFDLNLALVPIGAEPENVLGDADCNDNVDAVDGLKILRHNAELSVSQNEPCPDIGAEVNSLFGDVDCDNDVDSVDALKVLRFIAALSIQQEAGCRAIGT